MRGNKEGLETFDLEVLYCRKAFQPTLHVPTSRLLKDSPPHPRTSLSRSLFPRTSLLFTVFHCRCSVLLLTLHLPPAPLRSYPHTHVTCVQGDPQGRPQDLPYRPVTISPSSTSTPPPTHPIQQRRLLCIRPPTQPTSREFVRVKIDIVFVPHTPCPVPDIVPLLLLSSTLVGKHCTPYEHERGLHAICIASIARHMRSAGHIATSRLNKRETERT